MRREGAGKEGGRRREERGKGEKAKIPNCLASYEQEAHSADPPSAKQNRECEEYEQQQHQQSKYEHIQTEDIFNPASKK